MVVYVKYCAGSPQDGEQPDHHSYKPQGLCCRRACCIHVYLSHRHAQRECVHLQQGGGRGGGGGGGGGSGGQCHNIGQAHLKVANKFILIHTSLRACIAAAQQHLSHEHARQDLSHWPGGSSPGQLRCLSSSASVYCCQARTEEEVCRLRIPLQCTSALTHLRQQCF